jgi:single-strand DNA-binding protein
MSINKVILVGNVGKDPVVRYFDKGVAKANFPLATSETYTNQQGETITSTEWHNIVLWRALAEVAEKTVKKGAQLYIIGKIKTRSYVDKEGVNKYITEILADTLLLLDKKQPQTNRPEQSDAANKVVQAKPASESVVNDPAQAYQASSEGNKDNLPGKTNEANNDSDTDQSPANGTESNQSEDDLPF